MSIVGSHKDHTYGQRQRCWGKLLWWTNLYQLTHFYMTSYCPILGWRQPFNGHPSSRQLSLVLCQERLSALMRRTTWGFCCHPIYIKKKQQQQKKTLLPPKHHHQRSDIATESINPAKVTHRLHFYRYTRLIFIQTKTNFAISQSQVCHPHLKSWPQRDQWDQD